MPSPRIEAGPTSSSSSMVFAACFLVVLIDGYDTLMLSFLAPLIAEHFSMQPGAFGQIFAATYAGAAIGGLFVGMAADRWGRKRLMQLSLLTAGVFTLSCAWASSPQELMLLRFLAGLGLGGAIPCASAMTGEQFSSDRRAQMVSRMFLGFPIGAILGGALTAAVMPVVGWQGVFIGGGSVAIVAMLFISKIRPTESPTSNTPLHKGPQHPGSLFAEGRALGASMICVAAFLMLMVTYFLVSWTPTVMTMTGLDVQKAALAGVTINIGAVLGALGMSFFFRKKDPFPRVALWMVAGALFIPVFGFSIGSNVSVSFALIFVVGLLLLGGQQNFPALCVHFFPPELRATGVGISMACGRLGSIVGPVVGGMLVSSHRPWSNLFVIAAVPALLAGIALWFVRKPQSAA